MALPVTIVFGGLAAGDADLYALTATPTSGTALTLTGVAADFARRVLLTHGNEASARTLRITGTNADGNPIRETLAVPSGAAGTVSSIQDFKTVTQAMPLGSGWTAAATLGTNGVASTPWKLTNSVFQAGAQVSWGVLVSGTINYDIEYTYENPNNNQYTPGGADGNYPATITAWNVPGLTGRTVATDAALDNPVYAWRATINSGGGSITVTAIEAGMSSGWKG